MTCQECGQVKVIGYKNKDDGRRACMACITGNHPEAIVPGGMVGHPWIPDMTDWLPVKS